MSTFRTKDGRNVVEYTMTFNRIDLILGTPTPIPVESEFLKIRSDSTNGGTIIYVGNSDVNLAGNGYELTAGEELSVSGGLGQYIAANTIYVIATANCTIFYMAHN